MCETVLIKKQQTPMFLLLQKQRADVLCPPLVAQDKIGQMFSNGILVASVQQRFRRLLRERIDRWPRGSQPTQPRSKKGLTGVRSRFFAKG
jgi:hypothetical protein